MPLKPSIPLPPVESLNEAFVVDPSSPSGLRWKARPSKNRSIATGAPAGTLCPSGHWEVLLNRRSLKVHRLIYKITTGQDPVGYDVTHIDGNRKNNDPANLSVRPTQDRLAGRPRKAPYRHVTARPRKSGSSMSYVSRVFTGNKGQRASKAYLGCYANPYEAAIAAIVFKRENCMRYEYAPAGTM